MKVLLSAYACEPGKGSEPGVGWRWAGGMASLVSLHVLTREANRHGIESDIRTRPDDDPLRSVVFYYHDLGPPWLWLKRRGWLPTFAYYMLWQAAVARRFGSLAESMDVVHHLTFCNLLCPGFWRLRHGAFVVGPVGAPLVSEHYVPLFGRGARFQRWRGHVIRNFHRLPWLRRMLPQAAAIVPANSDTRRLLEEKGLPCKPVMLDTGAGEAAPSGETQPDGPLTFVFAGRLERRKGLELSLRALARAAPDLPDWRFRVIGDGPDAGRLKRLADDLGIRTRVEFAGQRSREDTLAAMEQGDAFLFTSIRDTSGGVNLEAMAQGLPVICLAHQGVADITDDQCAERVPPAPVDETIGALAKAILRLAIDPSLRARKGGAARERAHTCFSWESKFSTMAGYFREATSGRSSAEDAP